MSVVNVSEVDRSTVDGSKLDTSDTSNSFWAKKPYVLVDVNQLHLFCPSSNFTYEENMNALMRFALYMSLILFAFGFDYRAFYIFVVFGVISYFLWWTRKKNQLDISGTTLGTSGTTGTTTNSVQEGFHDVQNFNFENNNNTQRPEDDHDSLYSEIYLNVPLNTVEKRCASLQNPMGNPAPGDMPRQYRPGATNESCIEGKSREEVEQIGLLMNHYTDIEAEYPKGSLEVLSSSTKKFGAKNLINHELANGSSSFFGRQFYTVPGNGNMPDIPQFGEYLFSKTKRGRHPTIYRLGH